MGAGFSQAVNNWHDFYLLTGTAAGALIGLLFVALSVRPDVFTLRPGSDARALADQAFTSLANVLLISLIVLIPHQSPVGLGLPLLGLSLYGGTRVLTFGRHFRAALSQRGRRAIGSPAFWRLLLPVVSYLFGLVVAAGVLAASARSLYGLVPVVILNLASATRGAWGLLAGWEHLEHERETRSPADE